MQASGKSFLYKQLSAKICCVLLSCWDLCTPRKMLLHYWQLFKVLHHPWGGKNAIPYLPIRKSKIYLSFSGIMIFLSLLEIQWEYVWPINEVSKLFQKMWIFCLLDHNASLDWLLNDRSDTWVGHMIDFFLPNTQPGPGRLRPILSRAWYFKLLWHTNKISNMIYHITK